MNYLLVMPKKLAVGASTTDVIFPLGMAYVSASLKKAGYRIFTANLDLMEEDTVSVMRALMLGHDIDVVCTGGLSLDCHKIIEVIEVARAINPDVITVVGGGIISSEPEVAMRVLGADIGVIGEGEVTACELAHALDNGLGYEEVPGLIFRTADGALRTTSKRKEIQDIDTIPFPDFDGFDYGKWVRSTGYAGMVLSDRSCPFRCTFCFHPTGQKYRQRSLDNIFEEIDYQVQTYRVKHIGFTSELFATSEERVSEFCKRIKGYEISWGCCLRVTDVNAELLKLMKASGCREICFGLESADDSVLRSMRKGITVEQIARALDSTCDAGIDTPASNFIFGDINETWQTVENTLGFWYRYNTKVHINLTMIQTFPGTYLYEHACRNGIITDREQFLRDGCPVTNVSRLTDEEYHRLRSLVNELRLYPHVPAEALRVVEIGEDGSCRVEYSCRKCGGKTIVDQGCWYKTKVECPRCSAKNEIDPFRCAAYRQEEFFKDLPNDGPVALWGAGGIFYKLIGEYGALSSDRFVLVDADECQQGFSMCKKEILAPASIAEKGMKTVVITALSRLKDIHASLLREYPSVTRVFVPSLRVSEQEIIPVLKEYRGAEERCTL